MLFKTVVPYNQESFVRDKASFAASEKGHINIRRLPASLNAKVNMMNFRDEAATLGPFTLWPNSFYASCRNFTNY